MTAGAGAPAPRGAALPGPLFSEQHRLFASFLSHSTQERTALRYLAGKAAGLRASLPAPIRYLDVGCGYGTKTAVVIEGLGGPGNVVCDALDPSQDLLDCFAGEAARLGVSLSRATLESFPIERAYDLVTSIHVFYYVSDWATAISRLRSALSPGGRICICLRSEDEVCRFKDEFLSKLHGAPVRERTSTELAALLDGMGIPSATDLVESRLDLSDALRMERSGTDVIGFLLRRPFPSLPEALRADVLAYLRERHPDGVMKHVDGFVWFSAEAR